jgi:hypothetical protein
VLLSNGGRNDHTNGDEETQKHPIRPFCSNPSKIDEYELRPKTPKPLFIQAAEHLSTWQIVLKKIEITPRYNRPPWTTIDHQQHDFEICAIIRGSNNQRFRAETNQILKEKTRYTKIYLDGSKKEEEVEYAAVWEEQTI